MDTCLEFVKHTANIVHTGQVRAQNSRTSKLLVKALLHTYVRPILEYCNPVWSPYRVGLIKKIKAVQCRHVTLPYPILSEYMGPNHSLRQSSAALQVRRTKRQVMLTSRPTTNSEV
jgi:hypothetical protein